MLAIRYFCEHCEAVRDRPTDQYTPAVLASTLLCDTMRPHLGVVVIKDPPDTIEGDQDVLVIPTADERYAVYRRHGSILRLARLPTFIPIGYSTWADDDGVAVEGPSREVPDLPGKHRWVDVDVDLAWPLEELLEWVGQRVPLPRNGSDTLLLLSRLLPACGAYRDGDLQMMQTDLGHAALTPDGRVIEEALRRQCEQLRRRNRPRTLVVMSTRNACCLLLLSDKTLTRIGAPLHASIAVAEQLGLEHLHTPAPLMGTQDEGVILGLAAIHALDNAGHFYLRDLKLTAFRRQEKAFWLFIAALLGKTTGAEMLRTLYRM